MATSVKNSFMNTDLISNLQQALILRKDSLQQDHHSTKTEEPPRKPVVLVTNGEGIDSPGLTFLVQALLRDPLLDVCVCVPQSDRSVSGHSVTPRETIAAYAADIAGATAYEVTGTPADCVSLALSGALFSWTKPLLVSPINLYDSYETLNQVISGINRGAACGYDIASISVIGSTGPMLLMEQDPPITGLYSGAVAGAREALICGVPSLCISLNWKKNVSCESDLKDAVSVCLPLVHAAIRDIKKGIFPKNCFLNIGIPSCPLRNKGVKVTRQSAWRSCLSWQAVSGNRRPSANHYTSNRQSLGIMLAQLGRDASAAAAARRVNSQRKNVEIESVGVAGKHSSQRTIKKYFRVELIEKEQQNGEEDVDFRALEEGFVTVISLSVHANAHTEIQSSVSNWLAIALTGYQ